MPKKNKIEYNQYMKVYMKNKRVNPIVNPIVNPVKKVVKIITIRNNHHYDFMRWVYKNHEVMEEIYKINL